MTVPACGHVPHPLVEASPKPLFYTFKDWLARQQEHFMNYKASIVDDCIGNSWPNVIHPFFRKRDLNEAQITERFSCLVKNAFHEEKDIGEQIRRFLFETLPWTSAEITVKQSRGNLSVSLVHHNGKFLLYTETENKVEIKCEEFAFHFSDN